MESESYEATVIEANSTSRSKDRLAPEAPLHISVNGEAYVTTMRTPDGFDLELAQGLLFTEGIVTNTKAEFDSSTILDPESGIVARLDLQLNPADLTKSIEGRRNQMATSSCGICGTRDPADLELYGDPLVVTDDSTTDFAALSTMMATMRSGQRLFQETGGTHGACAFDERGQCLALHEDVGRHNAVDKVIGTTLKNGFLSEAKIMTVSSRVSYEIVTKAYRAEIPVIVAVSAPTSMAVETARAFGITLIGFCREGRMSVYSHPQRVAGAS